MGAPELKKRKMLKNLVDEDYLKGYAVKLSALLWTDETDWSEQKARATQFVFNNLIQKGYDVKKLMPELVLRSSGVSLSATATETAKEDTINRLRLVIDNITNTISSKVLTLQGSNDNSIFADILTITIDTAGTDATAVFFDTYLYYRISATVNSGVCDYRAYITETVYDELFACKWLSFIYADLRKQEGDQFDLRLRYYDEMYNSLMNSATLYIDSNSDGIPDTYKQTNILNVTR